MYYVNLSHAKNPDITNGGYWEQPKDAGKSKSVKCATLQEAAQECRAYIERNGLGSGNWTGGAVFFGSNRGRIPGTEQVATISYNGRIWDMTDKEIR